MLIKGIIDEDLINYKKPSMTIMMPICKNFKCDKECGERVCQNSALATAANISIPADIIVSRYLNNDITQAIVFQGLEPFDSWEDLYSLIKKFRQYTQDDIVIYTGYTEKEIQNQLYYLKLYYNIIIKFGRYIPHQELHYDKILEVQLASLNQYAKRIS